MSETIEGRRTEEDGLQARMRMLSVRNDLLDCPEDLRLAVTRLFHGLPQLREGDTGGMDEDDIREAWHRIVGETISSSGVAADKKRLARLLDCAGTFGWTDPTADREPGFAPRF